MAYSTLGSNQMNNIKVAGNIYLTLVTALLLCNLALAHDGETHQNQSSNTKPAVTTTAAVTSKKKTVWGKNYFPNSTLITQDGDKVRFFDDLIKDRVVAINFIFTS